MRYDYLIELDNEDDREYYGGQYMGHTIGCGCCSSREPLTRELLNKYIGQLESALEKAKDFKKRLDISE